MPFIAPQVRQQRGPLTVRLDVRLQTLLKHYAEFITSSPDYIIGQALLVAFAGDGEFQEWLDRMHPENAGWIRDLAAEQPGGSASAKRRRRAPERHGAAGNLGGSPEPAGAIGDTPLPRSGR
jgi:hypothetical protein